MFQARVAGFLLKDRSIVRRGENPSDRDLMRDRALREYQPLAASFEYPKLQKHAQAPQGARRVAIAKCGRACGR